MPNEFSTPKPHNNLRRVASGSTLSPCFTSALFGFLTPPSVIVSEAKNLQNPPAQTLRFARGDKVGVVIPPPSFVILSEAKNLSAIRSRDPSLALRVTGWGVRIEAKLSIQGYLFASKSGLAFWKTEPNECPPVSKRQGVRALKTPSPNHGKLLRLLVACLVALLMFGAGNAQVIVPEITLSPEAIEYLKQGKRTPTPDTPPPAENRTDRTDRRTKQRNPLDVLDTLRSWDDWEREFESTVTISGRKSLGFHLHQVEGDSTSFRDQNYFGQGGQRYTDNTDLTIRMNKFLGFLSLDWRWTNSRFRNPYDARITYSYETPDFTLEWGDITASLGGTNQLVSFNRTLRGITGSARWGRNTLRYIQSETKAGARTITIQGNDSPGPYYLQGSQIVDGSERVQVDGIDKRRGEDYTIDYFAGILRFREGLIIPRTSTIIVTYETYAFNSAPSRLEGWRWESQLGRGYNLGVSMLSQKARGGTALRRRTEQFYGRGAPSVPYDLEFVPIVDASNPILITVAGVPQQPTVDYYFDEVLPYRFYFTRFIPQNLIVQVEYTPRPDPGSTIGGNREVMGLDLTVPLGGLGSLVWNYGRSRAQSLGANLEANAHILVGKFNFGALSVDTTWRDIPAQFIGIESVGFRRNERGHQTSLLYRINPISQLQVNLSQSRVASLSTSVGQFGASFTDTTIQTFAYSYTPADGFNLNLNRSVSQLRSGTTRSDQTRDTATLSRSWKQLNLLLGYDRAEANALGNLSQTRYRIQTLRSQADWTVNSRLTLRATASTSEIRQNQTNSTQTPPNTRARDYSLSLNWRPLDTLSVNYRLSDTDSGTLGASGLDFRSRQGGAPLPTGSITSPWGVGFNGNGFSSGAPLFSGYTYYGVRGKGQDLSVQWNPFENLSVDLQWSQQRSAGDFQTNSEQNSLAVGVSYVPVSWLALSASWSTQEVQFLTATGNSTNRYFTLSADIGPIRRWTISLGFYQMTTSSVLGEGFIGGEGSYRQEPIGFSGRISYDLGARQNLFAEFQRVELKGYLPSRDTLFNIGYEYRITRNWAFVLSYRFREQLNLDPQYSQFSYRARSLDANLNFVF